MGSIVREPIQVYLTAEERERLDRVATSLGVSRSEALRRGVLALARDGERGPLAELRRRGLIGGGDGEGPPPIPDPPPPVAPLEKILEWLDEDRQDR